MLNKIKLQNWDNTLKIGNNALKLGTMLQNWEQNF